MNIGGGTLTATDSTISGNTATGGGGIYAIGTTVNLANTIVSGNTADADIDGSINDNGGNQVGVAGINLAPLGSYGGPTQTMPALPGSPAICAGTLTNWNAASLTADQRGFGLLSTYCPAGSVDSGAVQTNYALAFTTEPPASAGAGASLSPAPVVTLTESGSVFAPATSAVNMTDADSALSGGTNSAALSSGMATFTNLIIASIESGDKLTASLSLNPNLSPALNPHVVSQALGSDRQRTGHDDLSHSRTEHRAPRNGNVTFQWGSWVRGHRISAQILALLDRVHRISMVYEGDESTSVTPCPTCPQTA
jgi:large repetitive protein